MYEKLKALGEQLIKRASNCKNEEATKQALILPFIQSLGYDIYDPTTVLPEYRADFSKKPTEKVDYAIMFGGAPGIFVEAKSYGSTLEDHDGQLARYFNSTLSTKLGILTDGIRYRFFTDLQNPNVMDPEPFLAFSFESLTERDAELLRHFVQGAFDPLKTTTLAEDIVYTEKAQQKVAEILRRPSEGFIRFILEGIFPGRLTSKTVERFTPIIQKALQSAIVATVSKAVTEYEDAEIEITVEDAPRKTGVVTTQEELDFFAFVSTVIGQPLQYKDTINYFGILGDDGKGFVKVVCSSKSKSLGLNLALEEVQALLPGFQVGNAPKHLGCTRVYLTNLADPALAPLLLAAYKAR